MSARDDCPECYGCGKPLTADEEFFYECQCEECVRKEQAAHNISCGFCRGGGERWQS